MVQELKHGSINFLEYKYSLYFENYRIRKPQTDFFLYIHYVNDEFRKKYPYASFYERMKLISEEWHKLDSETKNKFKVLAEEDLRYKMHIMSEKNNKI